MMTRLLALLAALTVSGAALPQNLRVAGDRLFVPVAINGVGAEALLDSGAELTLIDAAFAGRLGVVAATTETARGTGGSEQVGLAQGVDIRALGIPLSDLTVAILDLSDISERLIGEHVDVVLGRELFDAGRFLLNIENRQFERIDSAASPAGVRIDLIDHKGIKQLPITIEGRLEAYADFDLGNGGRMLVGKDYASAHGLLGPDRNIGVEDGGGIGGVLSRNIVRLASVTVAGRLFESVDAAVDATEDAPAANVGVPILRNFVMTIDFPENAVWLEPYPP